MADNSCARSRLMPVSHGINRFREVRPYRYESLDDPSAIRLLLLQPGLDSDRISANIITVSLLDAPEYIALSYTWGDPLITRALFCGGCTIQATVNLYKGLWHLRSKDACITLWVDALCMNQNDLEERRKQVQRMGDIYSKAAKVIVWLGEETLGLESSFTSLRKAASFLPDLPKDVYLSPESLQLDDNARDEFLECEWKPIVELLQNPWFNRKWVIQEVAKAKKVVVVCGDQELLWEIMEKITVYLVGKGLHTLIAESFSDSRAAPFSLQNILIMSELRQKVRQISDDTFILLVLETSASKCTDPRDHIYALLPLSTHNASDDWDILPDYTLTPEEVFKRFAFWCIFQKRTLLYLAATPDLELESELDLPSWVPDLSKATHTTYLSLNGDSNFAATRDIELQAHIWNENVLRIKGKMVDKIRVLGRSRSEMVESVNEILKTRNDNLIESLDAGNEECTAEARLQEQSKIFYQECEQIALGQEQSFTPERKEAYWKTMTCETDLSARASPECGKFFEMLYSISKHIGNLEDIEWDEEPDFAGIAKVEACIATGAGLRRFSSTENGRLACMPVNAQLGDDVCIFFGGRVPYVIRPCGDGFYKFIGQCYVNGIMDGEALDIEGLEIEEFSLC